IARIWDAATGKLQNELTGGAWLRVNLTALTPDGRYLLTVSGSPSSSQRVTELRLWEVETGRPYDAPWVYPGEVVGLRFLPDGVRIRTTDRRGPVQAWHTRAPRRVPPPLRHAARDSGSAESALSPDGRFLLTRDRNGSCTLWDLAVGRPHAEPLPLYPRSSR